MIGSLGWPEILFILLLALLIFGPRRLPEIGRTIGKGLGEFRRATSDFKRTIETEVAIDESPPPRPRPAGTEARARTEARASAEGEPESAESGDPAP